MSAADENALLKAGRLPHDPEEDAVPIGGAPGPDGPILVPLSEIQPEKVAWLWRLRVPAAKLTLIAGDPGIGKSYLSLDLAARASRGKPMPAALAGGPPIDVVLLSAEDGAADTIRPRLDRLGADVRRIHLLDGVRVNGTRRTIANIAEDAENIERAIRDAGAKLVIIDPITAYVGGADSHRDADVRGLLAPLGDVAQRTSAAIVLVMHLNKSDAKAALYRVGGSVAWVAAVRCALAVVPHPTERRVRIVGALKANLAPTDPEPIAYRIDEDGGITWGAEVPPGWTLAAAMQGGATAAGDTGRALAEALARIAPWEGTAAEMLTLIGKGSWPAYPKPLSSAIDAAAAALAAVGVTVTRRKQAGTGNRLLTVAQAVCGAEPPVAPQRHRVTITDGEGGVAQAGCGAAAMTGARVAPRASETAEGGTLLDLEPADDTGGRS